MSRIGVFVTNRDFFALVGDDLYTLYNPPLPLKPPRIYVCVPRKTVCPGVGDKQCKSTRFLEHGEHRYSDYQEVKFFRWRVSPRIFSPTATVWKPFLLLLQPVSTVYSRI